jgi:hypothetical protein
VADMTLAPITAQQAINDIRVQLEMATRYGVDQGLQMDKLDVEHVRRALAIVTMLCTAQEATHA